MATVLQPAGTVTLVFTDVEGSTRLLTELGQEVYRQALAAHREVVREAFGRYGGYEVDHEGDGFFYAFAAAADALQAVAEALAALAGGPIRIRVGVHTGEPGLDPPKYVGLDVHKAARITSAGHGGQVLLSQSTRELLDDRFVLRDLGEHRLKDLSRPQRLYQLGEGEFPALKTLFRTNLPVPATEFLGREQEVNDVAALLRDGTRLLTLTGPGGTGKTRLGLHAAGEVADEFPDGVWWVALAPLSDPTFVLPAVAHTFDIPDQPDRDLGDTLAEALVGKRLLLLLDNAEHLLPDIARAIARLRDTDGPKVVVTSRERLQLAGEHVYPVPQLTRPEGTALFAARAGALLPDFEVTPGVEELCTRLDNLPLAIELAAARTTTLTPEQMLERLSKRLDLLKAGRDADPRQQTLRSLIEWSFDLLDTSERELFVRFAVFTGGSTLAAAEKVCDADLDTLASLVDKSLVRHTGERFWMLETIREYAAERLGVAADVEQLRLRHCEFYERFAQEAEQGMRGASVLTWFAQVEHELPNIRVVIARSLESGDTRAALQTSAALLRYWEARSGASEGRAWLDRALATGAASAGDRARGSYAAARLALFQGDLEGAGALFAAAAESSRLAGDDATLAAALAYRGWVREEQGDLEAGVALMIEARELALRLPHSWVRTEALLAVAVVMTQMGDTRGGDALNREVLAAKRELGDEVGLSDVAVNLGYSALLDGRYDDARTLNEEGLEIARRLGDTFRITLALGNLGLVAVLEGRNDEAIALLDEDLRLCVMRRDRRCGTEAILRLAAAHAALGNGVLAVRLDAIHRDLLEAAGIVYPPGLLESLEIPIRQAREGLDPAVGQAMARENVQPSLEAALAVLEPES